ncbi:MAG: 50S ribosomal protein L9 [Rhodobacteraceae bacterium]|nr:MAG: 50S ribosomal protein L9 [Paracoccaceae bacterium]
MVQLVLLERVSKLGSMGDIVNVKPGYARNYLLPQKKALRASEDNIKKFEADRKELEAKNLETKKEAEKIKAKIDGSSYIIIRSASDSGSLYGSVTNKDAETAMKSDGLLVDKKQIVLSKPIKELGLHDLTINLHPEVIAKIEINVARSNEEAEIQKSGKTIQDAKMEAEAEAEFDIAELFDDVGSAARIDNDLDQSEDDPVDEKEDGSEKSSLQSGKK